MNRLEEIFSHKRSELVGRKAHLPLGQVELAARLASPPQDFVGRLKQAGPSQMALIAEIKRASPSRGLLAPGLDAVELAGIYAASGAAAISVLTEERYFLGSLEDLSRVAQAGTGLPVLRKDFICDAYQVFEARAAGADAVLLIVAGLDPETLYNLHALVLALGMTPLVEIHNLSELQTALACQPVLIGINNRNLHDFTVDLQTCLDLRPLVPAGVCVVAESGIHSSADVRRLAEAGMDAILVGEALVTAPDIPARVRSLVWYT